MKKNKDPKLSEATERKIKYTSKATKQEIHAALKLVELLCIKGELPQHVYRNICTDYYGKGIDITENECYNISTPRQDVV